MIVQMKRTTTLSHRRIIGNGKPKASMWSSYFQICNARSASQALLPKEEQQGIGVVRVLDPSRSASTVGSATNLVSRPLLSWIRIDIAVSTRITYRTSNL